MTVELGLSIAAISISMLSLGVSSYVAFRDRSKIKTVSHAYRDRGTGEFSTFHFTAINTGRRPIILTKMEGLYEGGIRCSEYIEHRNGGKKLGESEFFEHRFAKYDGIMVCDPTETGEFAVLIDLWVVDSAGKKYRVRGAKENVEKLSNSGHSL